jgi:hypothetical protein
MADYLGAGDELGSVTPGKYADFFLVPGDPTEDFKDLKTISMVVADGVVYFPAEIYPEFGIRPFVDAPTVTGGAISLALEAKSYPSRHQRGGTVSLDQPVKPDRLSGAALSGARHDQSLHPRRAGHAPALGSGVRRVWARATGSARTCPASARPGRTVFPPAWTPTPTG